MLSSLFRHKSRVDFLSSPKKLGELLAAEKIRRGVAPDKLVFVGMANLAKYYWCAVHSVLESRERELLFFGAYLQDRIEYGAELGLIKTVPKDDDGLLHVGDEITFGDIEKLLKKKSKVNSGATVMMAGEEFVDKNGHRAMVLNPDLLPEERLWYKKQAKKKGVRIAGLEENPIARGNILHFNKAEKYNSIRWNFQADDYVVVGVPDGITDDFVYEYKSTANNFFAMFVKPCAFAQADLYGHFFRRKNKRVQIYISADGTTQTWVEPINEEKTVELLANFAKVDEGKLFPPAPKKWKCGRCEICGFGKLCQNQA